MQTRPCQTERTVCKYKMWDYCLSLPRYVAFTYLIRVAGDMMILFSFMNEAGDGSIMLISERDYQHCPCCGIRGSLHGGIR